ncbi:MAG: alpha-1,2-fucosyltransferase [Alphaproteobacteria bacterium]|nr:alpha-1,2-fucosyltransferase [Alphaproteobacteria bacterium]
MTATDTHESSTKNTAGRMPVCVRIWGGLGNQMFQYAAGHALARRLDTRLLIDPLEMDFDHAELGLGLFGLAPEIWRPDMSGLRARFAGLRDRGATRGKKRYKLWPGKSFFQQAMCHADDFWSVEPGTYVAGYFQSEQFFADCADEIRALFALESVDATMAPDLLEAARHPASVSVHVRRGDYAANARTAATHGLLGADYYEAAAALMARIVPDARWLVFSDDIAAAAELTAVWPNRTLVEGQSREQDLRLMSLCAHHITANSSFSWWGAWLGRNPERQVIVPRQWFARAELRRTYVDEMFPRGWILL